MRVTHLVFLTIWLMTGAEGKNERKMAVQTDRSVAIPCHYDRKYIHHKKYWCFHARASYNYCSILAYANETKGKVSITDHPEWNLFTVTMRNLRDRDTGAYWCAVEINGGWDVTEKLSISIQSVPDLSVVSSNVSGHEGGDISVKCLYSSAYKNKHKHWCRYKDKSCFTVGKSGSQSSSMEIVDDKRESFTVLMSGLVLSDSGWFFCSVGDLQAPVLLTVTDANVSVTSTEICASSTVAKTTADKTDAITQKKLEKHFCLSQD